MFSIEDLTKRCKGQNYRDLQKAAKSSGIKANLKKEELCDKIATFLKGRKESKKDEDCNKLLKAQILDKVYKQPTLTRAKSYYQKMKKADLCNLLEDKPKSPVKLRSKSPVKSSVKLPLKASVKSPLKSSVYRLKGKGFTPVEGSPYYSPPRTRGLEFYGSMTPDYYGSMGIEFTSPMSPMLDVYDFE